MKPSKCTTSRCRNIPQAGRKLCAKCRSRAYRKENPFRCKFLDLRNSAKRRGIEFTLCLDDFTDCINVAYQGNIAHKDRLSVDRIDPKKGYEKGNIRACTVSRNVLFYWDGKRNFEVAIHKVPLDFCEDDEVPF